MKKLLSFLIVLLLSTNIMTVSAADVITANSPISSTFEVTDGLSVTYNASQAWAGKRNVEIKLANIGTEVIENWSLAFATPGKISNLWNAQILKQDGEKYIIKNSVHNKDIAVGGEITFGYTLTDGGDTAPEFIYATKRTELADADDVTVEFKVTSDWGTSFQGEIIIKNNTDETVNAWELSFNKNFNLYNIWTCKTLSGSKSDHDFITSVSGNYNNIDIASGATETLTVTGAKVNGKIPNISDVLVSACVFDESVLSVINDQTESEIPFVAVASFTPPDIITFVWTSAGENGTYSLLASDSENSGYTQIAEIGSGNEYDYKVSEAFTTQDFKIKFTDGHRTFETEPVIINGTGGDYAMEINDTDSDNLPDYMEKLFGTDMNKSDTDDDGLSDSAEIGVTGTDPTVYDSVSSGVSDADSDSDNDGLTAKYEISINTNPQNPDTDGDGLTDGEEIKLGTDPLDIDSDDDTINDYDETVIGLDPTTASTNGTPDNQRQFTVNLTADDEALSVINTTKSPYEISVEITAAGNVKANIEVRESTYTDAITSDAVVGAIAEFVYPEELTVGELNLSFVINESIVNESENGLDRFTIFRFDSETCSLIPEQSDYNYNDNKISLKSPVLGSYLIMDIEKLTSIWEAAFGIETDSIELSNIESNDQFTTTKVASIQQKAFYSKIMPSSLSPETPIVTASTEVTNGVNIIFMLDSRKSISEADVDIIAEQAKLTFEVASRKSNTNDARVYVLTYGNEESSYYVLNGSSPFTSGSSLKSGIIAGLRNFENTDKIIVSDPLEFVLEINASNSYQTFAYNIFNEGNLLFKYPGGKKLLDDCVNAGDIALNIIAPIQINEQIGFIIDSQESTNGIYINSYKNFSDTILKQIFGDYESNIYIMSYNLLPVELDAPITSNYKSAYDEVINNPAAYSNYSYYADTDKDGKADFMELDLSDTRFSNGDQWISGNRINSTSVSDYINKFDNVRLTSYVQDNYASIPVAFNNTMVDNKDSDGDGLLDGSAIFRDDKKIAPKDPDPLKVNGPVGVWKQQIALTLNTDIPSTTVTKFNSNPFGLIGAVSLDMRFDVNNILHADVDAWQKIHGYKDLYDNVFNFASDMRNMKISFDIYDEEEVKTTYIVWVWRGDYLTLGAGAEIGLYYTNFDDISYAFSSEFNLPMTLNLYYGFDSTFIDHVFSWAPEEKQWWITGFDISHHAPDPKYMTMISSIDFELREDMFNVMKSQVNGEDLIKDYFIFDEDGHTVWITWWDK